jgi:hypothetical protein
MSVGNLSMVAFTHAKEKYGVEPNTYGGVGGDHFMDRAAQDTHTFLSHSAQTMGSQGSVTSWRSRNPSHVQGAGRWNYRSTVTFDDPQTTPRVQIQ